MALCLLSRVLILEECVYSRLLFLYSRTSVVHHPQNDQINNDHQNGTIRSAPSSTPITPLQSRISMPVSLASTSQSFPFFLCTPSAEATHPSRQSSVGRHGVGSRQSTPPPTTNHILHPFDRTRGRHETSNTRAAGSTPMTSTKYAAGNSGRERHRDDDATRAMSSVESYNRIFERLGTVAFFGNSLLFPLNLSADDTHCPQRSVRTKAQASHGPPSSAPNAATSSPSPGPPLSS